MAIARAAQVPRRGHPDVAGRGDRGGPAGGAQQSRDLAGRPPDDEPAGRVAALRRGRRRRGLHALRPAERAVPRRDGPRGRGRAAGADRVPGPHGRQRASRPRCTSATCAGSSSDRSPSSVTARGAGRSTGSPRAPSRAARTSTSAAARRRTRSRSAACGSPSAPRMTIKAAWIRFPGLTVEKATQTYTPARRADVPLRERHVRGRPDGRRRRPGRVVRGVAAHGGRVRARCRRAPGRSPRRQG